MTPENEKEVSKTINLGRYITQCWNGLLSEDYNLLETIPAEVLKQLRYTIEHFPIHVGMILEKSRNLTVHKRALRLCRLTLRLKRSYFAYEEGLNELKDKLRKIKAN